jgi:outer membrane protein TolC
VDKALAKKREAEGYRLLNESQCQCLAAANSTLGNLLAEENTTLGGQYAGRRDRDAMARSLLADMVALRAVEERNRSAGTALELYYRLAGAYFGRDQLDRSLEEVRRSIRNFRQAKATGLSVPGDEEKLQVREIELVDQKVQLDAAIGQLDGQLCSLIGVEPTDRQPLWPAAEMTVAVSPIDSAAAVAEGLKSRPDLALLCLLSQKLNDQTLPAARSALARLEPLVGGLAKSVCCLSLRRACDCAELEGRQMQVSRLLESRKQAAEEEIRGAVGDVERRLRQVGLAKDKFDRCQSELRRLRERREAKGNVLLSEVSAAQLELFRAESDAFQAVVEWKVAVVKLKQSQGLLASECGYTLPAACCEECLSGSRER